ncbi:MAG: hypothetical protein GY823_07275 [Flavobacteriaceae bacterium]|nr:hypothetical protein [Flavobacteriaceae bacterium]
MFQYKRNEYPNLCICAEIIITMSGSNSTVEQAFSTLRLLLSDRRLRMKHSRMEQLLFICANDKNWSDDEREEILERNVELYLEKRRKKRLVDIQEPLAKKKKIEDYLTAEEATDEDSSDDSDQDERESSENDESDA